MTTPKTVDEILKSDPFYSPDTNLDLSSFPWLKPLADAPVDDEKFAPVDTRGMGAGSSALKRFINAPDREAIEGLKDPELLKKFDEQHGSGTTVYASGIPFQVYQRDGKWHAKGKTTDGAVHRFTASTRDALFPKITSAVSETAVRELTESERLQVVRLAQGGDSRGAISRYLEFGIGHRRASSYEDANELLGDPRLAQVFDECSMLTWLASRPKVEDSDEFQTFLQQYRGGRPLNHDLLDGAYAAFEKQEYMTILPRAVQSTEQPATPVEIQAALEDASDADIEKMMAATKREYVRAAFAGRR